MKRRSARPFTVEIKHTRTSRAALSEATTPSGTGQSLWHDVSLDLAEAPAGPPPPRPIRAAPTPPEPPARRILPSLVPMFALPSEPVERPEPAVERLPRVRRPKPPASRDPDTAPVQVAPVVRSPATPPPPAPAAEASPAAPRPARPSRKATALRPGERWKRRLPRALR